ncbi:MAG TPA: hypothetical protein VK563_22940 [Puia sp.]|nr:hypothetical protein [Puia sp.]
MQHSKITSWLSLLGNLRPEAWDWIVPMGPVLSRSAAKVGVSLVLKSIGGQLNHQEYGPRVIAVGKRLFAEGVQGMSYDDEPDICPTYPWFHIPGHGPGPDPGPGDPYPIIYGLATLPLFSPQPEPWRSVTDELNPQPLPPKAAGLLLEQLASLVDNEGLRKELKAIGGSLARQ